MKRRGRRRKANASRERTGRVQRRSHDEREADIVSVAVEARTRVHGVFPSEARLPESGHAVGRALAARRITRQQAEAAFRFEELHRAYQRAILAKPMPSASDMDRQPGHDNGGGDEPGYVERCSSAEKAYKAARRVLLEASSFATFAVETWVIADMEADLFIVDLRIGLDALARLWRMDAAKAA